MRRFISIVFVVGVLAGLNAGAESLDEIYSCTLLAGGQFFEGSGSTLDEAKQDAIEDCLINLNPQGLCLGGELNCSQI